MTVADDWALLGIEPTDDKRAVKMAYTQRLKETDVDSDPSAFIRLREALEEALYWGTAKPEWEEEDWGDDLEQWPEGLDFQLQFPPGSNLPFLDTSEWHPPAPVAHDDALGEACVELDRLLHADEQPDPERIAALGDAIMSSPELVDVDRAAETEQWLAQLIPAAAPRSDPLIESATARFGWDRSARHWRREEDIELALERRKAVHFLARCRDNPIQRVALKELCGPSRARLEWDNLSLARGVRNFLALVDSQYPQVHRDLNPELVAWWRNYLAGAHLPASFWPLLLLIPLTVTLLGFVPAIDMGKNPAVALLLYPPAMLVTYVGILVSARIRAKARQRAEQFWLADHQSAVVPALILAALVLPPITAYAPDTAFVGISSAVLALLILAGVWWRILPAAQMVMFPGTIFMPAVAAICVLLMPLAAPWQGFFKILVPLAVLCGLGYLSFGAVQMSLLGKGGRRAAILGALILCLLAIVIVTPGVSGWPPPLWVLALVPVAIIAAHLATSASMVHLWEWPLRVCALILYWISGALGLEASGTRFFLVVLAYGLVYSFLKLVLAAIEDVRSEQAELS